MVGQFHPSCHGRNITVKSRGSVAIRKSETFDNGLVFSKDPCQMDEKISLLFKKTTGQWTGGPRIGFTNLNPDEFDPKLLPAVYTPSALSHTWVHPLMQTADENIFVEYKFDAIGLVTMRQFGQPETLLDIRGAVDFKKPVWVAVDLCGGYDYVTVTNVQTIVPRYILQEGETCQEQYLRALMKGSGCLGHTQLIVIGQSGAGKTSLLKTLIGQRFDPLESSTQGIDTSLAIEINETRCSGCKNDLDFRKRVVSAALDSSCADKSSVFLSLWDFGGNVDDIALDEILWVLPSIFILVFNLGHDLDKPAVVPFDGRHGKETVECSELTTWECMDRWMQSIPHFNWAGYRSRIIIVGTHKNCLGKNAAEKVSSQFTKLRNALSNAPYKDQVIDRFFAVENSLQDPKDSEVVTLRHAIEDLGCSADFMKEEIALKWLEFELARLEGPPIVSLTDDMIQTYMTGEIEGEARLMLLCYLDVGRIHLSKGKSEYGIVMDLQWVADACRRITACHEPKEEVFSLSKSWHRLTEEGILEGQLLDYLWRDLLADLQKQNVDVTMARRQLLAFMRHWGLLCERCPISEKVDKKELGGEQETLFMPSALRKFQVTKHTPPDPASSHVFYITCDHFVPDCVFNRIVVRALIWSQEQRGIGLEPRISHRQAAFSVDSDHDVELKLSPEITCRYITVCVKRLATVSFGASSKVVQPSPAPAPSVMCKVRDFLKASLGKDKYFWPINFRFCVPCPCDPEGALHFLSLSECLEKEWMRCPRRPSIKIDTSGVREMFCHLDASLSRKLDPYLMSEKHLSDIASKLGPEWEQLGTHLGFTRSNIFKFKQDNSSTNQAIFSMLVTWSGLEGEDKRSKVKKLSKALDRCERRDIIGDLLGPYLPNSG